MKFAIILSLSFLLLFGCAQVRQFTLDTSAVNLENAKVSRQIAGEYMSTWSINAGAAVCGASQFMTVDQMQDIEKISALVKKTKLWSEEDYTKGCFIGLTGKRSIQEIIGAVMMVIRVLK